MPKRGGFLLLASLLFLALILPQTLNLSFYHDEVMELTQYEKSPLEFVSYMVRGHLVRPPLFGIVQHYWMRAFGETELGLRSLSLLFSLACIPLVYGVAKSVYDVGTARAAVLLYSTSPFVLLWGRAAGWYPMMMAWLLMANGALLKLDRGRRYALLYGVSLLLALYTNYYAVALLLSHASYVLLFKRNLARRALAAQLVAVLLFAPWIPTVLRQFGHLRSILNLPEALGGLKTMAYVFYSFGLGETLLPSHTLPVSLFWLAVLWLVTAGVAKSDRRLSFLWISQIGLMLVAGLATRSLAPYRAYPFVVPFLIMLAAGFRTMSAVRSRWVLCLALLFPAWSLSILHFQSGREYLKIGMLEPWRAVHARIAGSTSENDTVIHRSEVLTHYNKLRPARARLVWLDDIAEARPLGAGSVWLMESFSSYRPDSVKAFEELRLEMERTYGPPKRQEALLRDPWWNEKRRWVPEWAFREEKLVLYEFSR
ncbi:MAG: glycosyltransferase family 39 protein [Nitrospirae bacterium]|nr:glycosyltransferase family 39 protein [Nitrospirota bacterium]